ncbi:MAG: sensor N-terminal transmembrane domain-containing protein [Alphaproteobacteria bacterium]|jgi:two-component system, OmpR family, sensor histidine kinase ChvG|nr:sensor N-terminal transmembrane domain-containing protein [Alphaproteobacteria bacterium]MBU2041848.1 sensor N-terminal transmembrane domain-containing protein [Alphaproteobacteria bacterium]MBU2127188.1 sensor N-terminal transmembrane domain-containing protein [Alphaproteobacteria bacterium]
MALDTGIAKADPLRPGEAQPRRSVRRFGGSRLGGLILALNLLSLLILFVGALALNEWNRGLIEARQETLTAQAELLSNVLSKLSITTGEPTPAFDPVEASRQLVDNFIPEGQRARLFDLDGVPIADSYLVTEAIPGRALPPARPAGTPAALPDPVAEQRDEAALGEAQAALAEEIRNALEGEPQATVRRSESGDRVVSVSIPVRHVRQVLGVLTLEAGDVDETLAAQRRALMPFALVALAVNLLGSLLMHLFVARPVMRLSAAADEVRLQRARAISLPDLEGRKDEIGDLARSLETMTETLSDRMDAIEAFAADVSHEIKNPLTSIRSALETLPLVKTAAQREKLTSLLQQDVRRLDRLITDISNASRLDAELNRDRPRAIDLTVLLTEIVGVYQSGLKPGEAQVTLDASAGDPVQILGRDGPLGQVFRNLIDNARSFSPPGGTVRLSLVRDDIDPDRPVRVRIDDDGPGIPPDNLETVFERFYTARPRGTAFGANSGLGLSIVRQIVEAHGGRVRAANRPDEAGGVAGARFEVALPAAPTAGRRP